MLTCALKFIGYIMAILPITTVPNLLLKQRAARVEKIDEEIQKLMRDMLETMYHDRGIGIAAPQVGVSKQIFVLDLQEDDDNPDRPKDFYPLYMVNPEIIWESEDKCIATEGCLSLPGEVIDVVRAEKIKLKYLDFHGIEQVMDMDGWLARAAQHELDHLKGITLDDYAKPLKKKMMIERVVKRLERKKKQFI